MFAKTATVFTGLIAATSAHMFMAYPSPFPNTSNSPLEDDGSNYPCHATSSAFYTDGSSTTWALGSKQTFKTKGTAVHGGGSGQFSVTYDLSPTKDTKWKVIHSVEGGMPARGVSGNLDGNNAEAANPDTYDFTVPTTLPAGEAIFAWSWLNRIGNREFYMSCAPITLTGTGGSQADFDALPDMLVLNIMGKAKTIEGDDYQFADPGTSVEDNLGKYGFPSVLCCDAGCGDSVCTASGGGSGSGSGSGSSTAAAPSATSTTQTTASIPGGVFITVAPSAGSTTQPAAVPSSTPTSAPAPAPVTSSPAAVAPIPSSTVASSPPASTSPATGSGSSLSGACTTEGEWNCIGGNSYQQCASGTWSTVMALAAGTTCQTGQSTELNISAAKVKRVMRAFRA